MKAARLAQAFNLPWARRHFDMHPMPRPNGGAPRSLTIACCHVVYKELPELAMAVTLTISQAWVGLKKSVKEYGGNSRE